MEIEDLDLFIYFFYLNALIYQIAIIWFSLFWFHISSGVWVIFYFAILCKYCDHSLFDKLAACCRQWIGMWVGAVHNNLFKFSAKLYPVWTGDTVQLLACQAPCCPYYLCRMPSRRLALICIALFGAFSNRLLVLVEDCDTWRLMACISDMPAGVRGSFPSLHPSFLPAKLC